MKNYKWVLLTLSVLGLSACASIAPNPHPGKTEHVGVLLAQECHGELDCTPFSLLAPDLQNRSVALSGRIDPALHGRMIAVLGVALGQKNSLEQFQVEKVRAITDFDYQPFLSKAVADYTQQTFSCASLWDQSYAWRLDGRQPVLIATLRQPSDPQSTNLQLQYDGLTQKLLSAQLLPPDADPCQLR